MMQLAHRPNRFHPAEGLLDELPFPWTEVVAGVSRRPGVDGAAPTRGLRELRHVRRHTQFAAHRMKSRVSKSLFDRLRDNAFGVCLIR